MSSAGSSSLCSSLEPAGASAPLRFRAYYLRRIRRIEPPYLINLAVCFAIIWLINPGRSLFVPHLVASLFYGHTLVYGDYSWINSVSWSLEVEAQFYLLMPALACLFTRRSTLARRVSLGLLILGTSALARLSSSRYACSA